MTVATGNDSTKTSGIDVTAVVHQVAASVVSIEAKVTVDRGPVRQTGTAVGTGIVVTSDGLVVTNAHVVDGATDVQVTLAGERRSHAAKVVTSDTKADLALLRVEGVSGLSPVTWAKSASVEVGDDVVAIGDALDLSGGPTVTRGIVSALDRSVDTETGTLEGLVQTDAAISSGNSGGPLVDSSGSVVGINTLVATSTDSTAANNIGFAIPADHVRAFIEQYQRSA